jgi:hypothetical protein
MASLSRRKLPPNIRERNGHYYCRTRLNGRQKEFRLVLCHTLIFG